MHTIMVTWTHGLSNSHWCVLFGHLLAVVDLSSALTECVDLYAHLVSTAARLMPPPDTAASSTTSFVPPEFARHCAAVGIWGNNLHSVWELALNNVTIHGSPAVRGQAPNLASWLPGMCCWVQAHLHSWVPDALLCSSTDRPSMIEAWLACQPEMYQ
jgi:hypothetical protein